jgi:hypothetical protein
MWRTGRRTYNRVQRGGQAVALIVTALLSASATARADEQPPLAVAPAAPPPAAAPSATAALPPPAADRSGFLHELGAFWNGSFGDFDTKMKNAWDQLHVFDQPRDQTFRDAAQATSDAATAVVRLPSTRVFELRERCRTAGNGAPDCQTTAADVCRGKGLKDGKPLDVSTLQDCPARVMLSGQPPTDAQCTDKTFLLGVICQ